MREVKESLVTLINKVKNNKVLLPDFQRGFVWQEEEKQAKLISSVLAKMPVGSILLLKSNVKDYAYKLIGLKKRYTSDDLGLKGEILALLDGQQRLTVLSNAFSNTIFDLSEKPSDLNAKALKRRFFLRLPKYTADNEKSVQDLFGIRKLSFPYESPNADEPNLLSDDVYQAVKVVSFNAGGKDCFNPYLEETPSPSELADYCTRSEEYLIPLFLLTGSKNENILKDILQQISDRVQMDIKGEYESQSTKVKKKKYAIKFLNEDIMEFAEKKNDIKDDEEFFSLLKRQGDRWVDDVKEYLKSCLDGIQLHQIVVDSSQRARAINIYENLNMGGVSLGTFELVMARFASISNENYYEVIKHQMKEKRDYPDIILGNELSNNDKIKEAIKDDNFIATVKMKSLDKDDNIIKMYQDAYLNVLSLYSHANDFNLEKINVDLIKKKKILEIDPQDLKGNCKDVCEALDKALMFFKTRCGLRSIQELNYSLMLVVVAYVLLNKKCNSNDNIYNFLEYWYWSCMFSGLFDKDQNIIAITSIHRLIESIQENKFDKLKSFSEKVCKNDQFFEKEYILLNKTDTLSAPKKFLRDSICQFYLRMTYHMLDRKTLDSEIKEDDLLMSTFVELPLEKHHIIPLGSISSLDVLVKDLNDDKRGDDEFYLNSPINFMYLTDVDNKAILEKKLSDYIKWMDEGTKLELGLQININVDSEDECKNTLEKRYDTFEGKLSNHLRRLSGE